MCAARIEDRVSLARRVAVLEGVEIACGRDVQQTALPEVDDVDVAAADRVEVTSSGRSHHLLAMHVEPESHRAHASVLFDLPHFRDRRHDVAADICAMRLGDPGARTAVWVLERDEFDEVMAYWRSGICRDLGWLRERFDAADSCVPLQVNPFTNSLRAGRAIGAPVGEGRALEDAIGALTPRRRAND